MLSIFCSPSRYTQGPHATRSLGQEMTTLGLHGPVLLVAGGHAQEQLSETWAETFAAAGMAFQVEAFGGQCTAAEIERIKALAVEQKARAIVGAGGGKVLDTARAAAADLELPVVCCPTTVASDAPCSAVSVLYTAEGVFEQARSFRRNPELVLVDTTLIAQGPPRMLVAGMGDALATYFEARATAESRSCNLRGGRPGLTALALAELCYRTLRADGREALCAAQVHAVTPAFERIVEANTLLSGLGFESGGLAAAHSIHNGLTAVPETKRYMHGEKVAFGVLVQLVLEGSDHALLEEVLQFLSDVGLPRTLADVGIGQVSPATLKKIALQATAEGEMIHHEPFPVTAEMVVDALLAADALGRRWQDGHPRGTPGEDTPDWPAVGGGGR